MYVDGCSKVTEVGKVLQDHANLIKDKKAAQQHVKVVEEKLAEMRVNLEAAVVAVQLLDDLPQAYAFFGIIAVMLVISAEFASIHVILSIRLLIGWLWDDLLLVHKDSFVKGME